MLIQCNVISLITFGNFRLKAQPNQVLFKREQKGNWEKGISLTFFVHTPTLSPNLFPGNPTLPPCRSPSVTCARRLLTLTLTKCFPATEPSGVALPSSLSPSPLAARSWRPSVIAAHPAVRAPQPPTACAPADCCLPPLHTPPEIPTPLFRPSSLEPAPEHRQRSSLLCLALPPETPPKPRTLAPDAASQAPLSAARSQHHRHPCRITAAGAALCLFPERHPYRQPVTSPFAPAVALLCAVSWPASVEETEGKRNRGRRCE